MTRALPSGLLPRLGVSPAAPRLALRPAQLHPATRRSWTDLRSKKPRPEPRPHRGLVPERILPSTAAAAKPPRDAAPGPKAQLLRLGLGLPAHVKRLHGVDLKPNPCNVAAFASAQHCVDLRAVKYLDDVVHPFAQSVVDRFAAAHQTAPLWWSVNAFGDGTPFVINTAERLLSRAVRLALEAAGYDRDGRALDGRGPAAQPDIYGTLRVTCAHPVILCQKKFEAEIAPIGVAVVQAAIANLQAQQRAAPRHAQGATKMPQARRALGAAGLGSPRMSSDEWSERGQYRSSKARNEKAAPRDGHRDSAQPNRSAGRPPSGSRSILRGTKDRAK
ncbi:uncharacterized protein JN550_001587 [Neoarthrinium moseri]|uniref:uncharacterized protein n=1 Tax=Neoarthrinium moseri TaxID=1658444 RepID=UPI001FDE52A4|nr:uncharacterized protein JN550_001587 [Neoarthrinium moseri]KAI1876091.1 hypothetical protein JN550_001587 [Neoarthrinium moseri]